MLWYCTDGYDQLIKYYELFHLLSCNNYKLQGILVGFSVTDQQHVMEGVLFMPTCIMLGGTKKNTAQNHKKKKKIVTVKHDSDCLMLKEFFFIKEDRWSHLQGNTMAHQSFQISFVEEMENYSFLMYCLWTTLFCLVKYIALLCFKVTRCEKVHC